MSVNSSNSPDKRVSQEIKKRPVRQWWLLIMLPAWVIIGFIFARELLLVAVTLLQSAGVDLDAVNGTVLQTTLAACIYILSASIVIGLPWVVKKSRTTWQDLGLQRLPSWKDFGLAPAAFITYLFASGLTVYVVMRLFPGFDVSEPQDVGFTGISQQYEYILAFITLVVIAPVAEEVLLRGYLYGKLRRVVPLWTAIVATSILFGLLHTQVSETGEISGVNVAVDVFVLSVAMCGLREITGSIWAGILLHMLKNGLAFYFLFINPSILSTIGG